MKVYKVKTNGYDMFVTTEKSEDGKEIVRFFTTAEFVDSTDIRDVEDDTSWEATEEETEFADFVCDAEIVDECEF